ncbi:hypothetical protein [Streptomyces griseoaurantiacus]|uniref:Uncharacterized protein n=1 Tax=Streptomyces griseoaurantiacus TaxID=68213 RepID=A0A7W2DSM9_9ACTN|nr:hypothetical protein [Streptomyces griseoaurantiacus]MBA5222214.1 hypothetical protein [Streptomyces griseoaurantiacus]
MTGTNTSRLGLYRPAASDDINVATDLNGNYDKLDTFVGTTVCTSSTRPNAPYSGQSIYETDTGRFLVSNGTSPASGSWKDPLTATNSTLSSSGGTVTVPARLLSQRTSSTSTALDVQVSGDSVARFNVNQAGKLEWGSGSATRDTNLYRSGANVLATDDSLTVGGGVTATGAVAGLNVPVYVYKAAATDRTSTTTLAEDPDLTFTLAGSAVYVVEFHLFVGSGTTGLMTTDWTVPSGASGLKAVTGPASTAVGDGGAHNLGDDVNGRFGVHGFSTTVTYGCRNSNTNLLHAIETATVITSTGGTCAIRWAQAASSSTATRMGLGAWARATRIA